MKKDNRAEKENIEKYTIKYFCKNYKEKLRVIEYRDKPDFVVRNEELELDIGVEVAVLWYDDEEAKMRLGRSKKGRKENHGRMGHTNLVKKLNELLEKKINKVSDYERYDKSFLVIRVASDIFYRNTLDKYEGEIKFTKN